MTIHRFLTATLNEYQGLFTVSAFVVATAPFAFKRFRAWFRNWFSKKDLQERMDVYEHNQENLQAGMTRVVKELTENGGLGGLKTSTMKDNINKALRDLGSLHETTKANSEDIKDLKIEFGDLRSDVSNIQGQVAVLVSKN